MRVTRPEQESVPLGCAIVEACIVALIVIGLLTIAVLASGTR